MTGRKIATLCATSSTSDSASTRVGPESLGVMRAKLGQHIHPHDVETQRAIRQNNGSIVSTTAAFERAHGHCPMAGMAFSHLMAAAQGNGHSERGEDLSELTAISFNGLKNELVSLDIHQDHYEPHNSQDAKPNPFANIAQQDFVDLRMRMPKLRHIEITCARLSSQFIEAMVLGLEGHPIEELILHHCGLCTDDLLTILEGMGRSLKRLDVSYNNFADHEVGALDFALAPALRSLDLSHCGIDLADVNLTCCTDVRELNLSSNASGTSFLMGHDFGSMPHLEVLQLNRTQLIGGSLGHLDLSTNMALHTLDLGYNALRNDDMHKFAVSQPCGIVRLNVSGNAIGAAGFITLQQKGLRAVQELNFADNDLKDYSRIQKLQGASLASWPELRCLDLAGCEGITKTNVLALNLPEALALSTLDLSATQLNDEAFSVLPWQQLLALRSFRAEFNHITAEGISHAAFERCPHLVELDLQYHAMGRKEVLKAFLLKRALPFSTLLLSSGDGQDSFPRVANRSDATLQPLITKLRQQLPAGAYLSV